MVKKTEDDADFLKRISLIKKKAKIKTKSEMKSIENTKEFNEMRKTGQQVGIIASEILECKKIIKEFESNPPVQFVKRFNDRTIESRYEPEFQNKINLLKKHRFIFSSAKDVTNTYVPYFSTFGKCYVKRKGMKIILPENSNTTEFIFEDGDILGADNNAFILRISEQNSQLITNSKPIYKYLTVFPNAKVKLSIRISDSKPMEIFMDPSKIPQNVKQKSKSKTIIHTIKNFELLSGLFYVDIRSSSEEPVDITSYLKISDEYPKIKFKSGDEHMDTFVKNKLKNLKSLSTEAYNQLITQNFSLKNRKSNVCSSIRGYIDLTGNSLVLITSNKIEHVSARTSTSYMSLGLAPGLDENVMKYISKEFQPVKVTVTANALHEIRCKDHPDSHVNAIIRLHSFVLQFTNVLQTKSDLENKIKKLPSDLKARKNADSAKEEAETMLEAVKEIDDKELIEFAETNVKSTDNLYTDLVNEKMSTEKQLKKCNQQLTSLKKKLDFELSSWTNSSYNR